MCTISLTPFAIDNTHFFFGGGRNLRGIKEFKPSSLASFCTCSYTRVWKPKIKKVCFCVFGRPYVYKCSAAYIRCTCRRIIKRVPEPRQTRWRRGARLRSNIGGVERAGAVAKKRVAAASAPAVVAQQVPSAQPATVVEINKRTFFTGAACLTTAIRYTPCHTGGAFLGFF